MTDTAPTPTPAQPTPAQTAALVTAARGGDEAAFTRLVDNHKEAVFAIAMGRLGDFDAARDVAQESFVRAFVGLGGLQEPERFSGWLRTIVENRCRSWIDRRQRQPPREVFDSTAPHLAAPDSPDRDLERAERRRVVRDAIERLAPDTRETVVLHYLEGVSTPQLATLLGISEPAVRQRLRRGREQMRNEVTHMIDETLREESPGDEFTSEVEALLVRSRGQFGKIHYRDAVADLERAIHLQPADPALAMLLADAYTFARSPQDLAEHPRDAERAIAILDEAQAAAAVESDRLVLRLKMASLQATLAFSDESGGNMLAVLQQNRELLTQAAGTPVEPIAQMELARRSIFSGQPDAAVSLYGKLDAVTGWNSLVLSETGLAHAAGGDEKRAIKSFERAITSTTAETMEALNAAFRQALGERYWSFWTAVETLEIRQCQNHAWLAGLRTRRGDAERGRAHLRSAIEFLNSDQMSHMRSILAPEMVNRFDQMFPELGDAPELIELRNELQQNDE
ncbi:MAG: sigma-70 family RNA polymerase sigma factor [Gemmatimonadetes bacterium]|nr:sigma-70 family RNA polymerase sigma factor [Gemmatimonadota bacterium]MBT4611006.1 sigma-70 family RNA polymerase sigma factor [Gemmatimonadota bacterium]MBT5060353.1 sigma-70 family RNA polymerase sigma factor [Gemmatimonadota bacterium]MBT5141795.1 sigma-70 family RNA polymerase sigma factor [Gemmatimonadota bacterium]MBT5591098.1 sigma-70 family RNA polymerase sigma factor [Gemmatimonadota bacterium]